MIPRQKNYLSNARTIPATIWALGFVTLLINSSTIIIFSLMPIYLTSVMGISLAALGRYEGLIEGTSWFVRIFSGPISDMLAKRKPILVVALACASISRIIFPYAPNAAAVVFARIIDRIGNGLQASPREALIGDIAPPAIKGTCYGLRQTLGLVGSCVGALLAMYIMTLSQNNYILAFWVAVIPAVLAIFLVVAFVKDVASNPDKKTQPLLRIFTLQKIKQLSGNYVRVVIFAALFMLSYYSGAFPILQAQKAGLASDKISLVMAVQNFMGFLVAFPVGMLSDRFGRKQFFIGGCLLNIFGNLLLAQTQSLPLVLLGIGIWGAQLGMMGGLISTKISENSPIELRATAFALYFGVNGLMVGLSNHIAGYVASTWGLPYVFYVASGFAALAMLGVKILPGSKSA